MHYSILTILFAFITLPVLAQQKSNAPERKNYIPTADTICISEDKKATVDPQINISSGNLEIMNFNEPYIVYTLKLSAEVKGQACSFELIGFAPKIQDKETVYRGFVNNKASLKASDCGTALNLNAENITFIMSNENKTIVVKGIDKDRPLQNCGYYVFDLEKSDKN